jgi:hypothetical protein
VILESRERIRRKVHIRALEIEKQAHTTEKRGEDIIQRGDSARLQLGQIEICDILTPGRSIVMAHNRAIPRFPQIDLDDIRARPDGALIGDEGVLGKFRGIATVRDDPAPTAAASQTAGISVCHVFEPTKPDRKETEG